MDEVSAEPADLLDFKTREKEKSVSSWFIIYPKRSQSLVRLQVAIDNFRGVSGYIYFSPSFKTSPRAFIHRVVSKTKRNESPTGGMSASR